MPIKSNQKIGKHTGTQIQFGTGDVAFAFGHKEGNEKLKSFLLWNDKPKPESEWGNLEGRPVGSTDTIESNEIVEMLFDNPESLKMMITELLKLLKTMQPVENKPSKQ